MLDKPTFGRCVGWLQAMFDYSRLIENRIFVLLLEEHFRNKFEHFQFTSKLDSFREIEENYQDEFEKVDILFDGIGAVLKFKEPKVFAIPITKWRKEAQVYGTFGCNKIEGYESDLKPELYIFCFDRHLPYFYVWARKNEAFAGKIQSIFFNFKGKGNSRSLKTRHKEELLHFLQEKGLSLDDLEPFPVDEFKSRFYSLSFNGSIQTWRFSNS